MEFQTISCLLAFSLFSLTCAPAQVPGTIRWVCNTGHTEGLREPAIADDGTIYVTSPAGRLFAVSPNGVLNWEFDSGHRNGQSTRPAIGDDGTIYFGTAGGTTATLFAVSPLGVQQWAFPVGLQLMNNVSISQDGTIYFSVQNNSGSNTNDGIFAVTSEGALKWRFKDPNAYYTAPPIIDQEGVVYWGSETRLYALNPDGAKKWDIPIRDSAACLRADGVLLVVGTQTVGFQPYDILMALNPDGVPDWQVSGGRAVAPIIGPHGRIFAASTFFDPDGAIRSDRGSVAGNGAIFGVDGMLYTASPGDATNALVVFNWNGVPQWQTGVPHRLGKSSALSPDGIAYLGTESGQLYAIQGSCGLANSSWPMQGGNPKRNGRVYQSPPIRPCLTPLRLLNNRGFQLTIRGELDATYAIETSTDLISWSSWTNVLQTNFVMHLTEASATNFANRFYRGKRL